MKFFALFIFITFIGCNDNKNSNLFSIVLPTQEKTKDYSKINNEAIIFCKENNFNEDYFFLIDMSIHSGKNRFFIHDFKKDSIIEKKLVTHGTCDKLEPNPEKKFKTKFSNKENSHCSSKGKYKIGKRDVSTWGIKVKYWLHGLEKSNNNALKRVVVLHSWEAVTDTEIYPNFLPLSWGCPAVSNEFMKTLDLKLQSTKKPVLLWIID